MRGVSGSGGVVENNPLPGKREGPRKLLAVGLLRVWRITCNICWDVRGLRLGRYGPDVGPFPVLGVWQLTLTTETSSFCFLNFYCKALCKIAQLGLTSQSSGSVAA